VRPVPVVLMVQAISQCFACLMHALGGPLGCGHLLPRTPIIIMSGLAGAVAPTPTRALRPRASGVRSIPAECFLFPPENRAGNRAGNRPGVSVTAVLGLRLRPALRRLELGHDQAGDQWLGPPMALRAGRACLPFTPLF
jgi:hypothetical protein